MEENAARLCAELYPNDLIFHRKVRIVSYCHDLLEDTNVTKELLRELGFTEELIEAIQLLTHKENQSYMEMIKEIDKNLLAWIVKIADNLANLSDTPTFKQIRKYSKSLQYLTCPLE